MKEITLKIDGMMCGMCEAHMNDAIRENFKVKNVTSSHSKGETVIIAEEAPDEAALKKVVDNTGYELKGMDVKEHKEKKGLFGLFK